MGCCKSKDAPWNTEFVETVLSSNRCDAHWENIKGLEATFGMGSYDVPCARFGILLGVIRCQVGYSGGTSAAPYANDIGDHTLAVNVEYDPRVISYDQLLKVFFTFHDIFLGSETPESRSTIFYRNDVQEFAALDYIQMEQARHEHQIRTVVVPFRDFISSDDDKQHSILQSHGEVMKMLKRHLRTHQIGYSHLAARLEGYLCGYASPEQFDKELPDLYIPEHLATLVRTICQENQIPNPSTYHMNDWG